MFSSSFFCAVLQFSNIHYIVLRKPLHNVIFLNADYLFMCSRRTVVEKKLTVKKAAGKKKLEHFGEDKGLKTK